MDKEKGEPTFFPFLLTWLFTSILGLFLKTLQGSENVLSSCLGQYIFSLGEQLFILAYLMSKGSGEMYVNYVVKRAN